MKTEAEILSLGGGCITLSWEGEAAEQSDNVVYWVAHLTRIWDTQVQMLIFPWKHKDWVSLG